MKKFSPKSPDSFLDKGADMSLAKFGHLNSIVDGINKKTIVSGSGATVTLREDQSTSLIVLDRAAGIVITLPPAKVGLSFQFIASVSVTSNAYKIITSNSSTFLAGAYGSYDTDTTSTANAVQFFTGNGSTHVSVSMNGTTTGGLAGTNLKFTCISATQWLVEGNNLGSGSVATAFATS